MRLTLFCCALLTRSTGINSFVQKNITVKAQKYKSQENVRNETHNYHKISLLRSNNCKMDFNLLN